LSKIIILGAGASHGHGVQNELRPPLANGFFNDTVEKSILTQYSDLMNYLERTVGLTVNELGQTDVEQLSALIEGSWRMGIYDTQHILRRFGASFRAGGPPLMLQSYVIDQVFLSTRWLRSHSCPLHDKLFTVLLEHGGTVMTFNYDLIAEVSLKRLGMWNDSDGYFRTTSSPSDVILLKPHGSLNWFKKSLGGVDSISAMSVEEALSRDGFVAAIPKLGRALGREDKMRGFAEGAATDPTYSLPFAVLPTPSKDFKELSFGQLETVWRCISRAFEDAKEVIAIGFSFRDEHFNQILAESVSFRHEPLKMLIVTPSNLSQQASRLRTLPGLILSNFQGTLSDFVTTL
jgi:hypothetical protein